MTGRPADYGPQDIAEALRTVGLRRGDVVYSHTSIGLLGRPSMGLDPAAIADAFAAAMREVIGADGTWVLPAYTYSYTSGEPFDPGVTPPRGMGVIPEVLWRRPDAVRSLDPIFSTIAIGPAAVQLVASVSADCFGPGSVFEHLLAADAVQCNVGIGVHSTLIHHVEQELGVPYRRPKIFTGVTIEDGRPRETEVVFNVRDLERPDTLTDPSKLDADARRSGLVRTAPLGRGEVNAIPVRALTQLVRDGLARDPEYLVAGRGDGSGPPA